MTTKKAPVDRAIDPRTLLASLALLAQPQQEGETEHEWMKRVASSVPHLISTASHLASTLELDDEIDQATVVTACLLALSKPKEGENKEKAKARVAGSAQHHLRLASEILPEENDKRFDHKSYVTQILDVEPVTRAARNDSGLTFLKAKVSLKTNSEEHQSDTPTTDTVKWMYPDGSQSVDPVTSDLAKRCEALKGRTVRAFVTYEMGKGAQGSGVKNKILLDVVDLGPAKD